PLQYAGMIWVLSQILPYRVSNRATGRSLALPGTKTPLTVASGPRETIHGIVQSRPMIPEGTISRGLVTDRVGVVLALAFAVSLLWSSPARADFRLCNDTS